MNTKIFVFAYAFLIASPVVAADGHMALFKTTQSFEDARDNVSNAITGKGMVINNVSHIGEMLARTGKDLGNGKPVYKSAEALEFCSAVVSRKMMEADPKNIVFCPYIISIYTLAAEPKTTYIAYRKPQLVGTAQSQAALKDVEKLLKDIVKEALAQ